MTLQVAPSRGRGSKRVSGDPRGSALGSPPHGGADRNAMCWRIRLSPRWSPPHGGVHRNPKIVLGHHKCPGVVASRGRGSNYVFARHAMDTKRVAPSRGCPNPLLSNSTRFPFHLSNTILCVDLAWLGSC